MGKISKFANLYDKEGNLLRHVSKDGRLKNITKEEVEEALTILRNSLIKKVSADDRNAALETLSEVYEVRSKETEE